MGTLKPQSNGPLYSNTVIGTLTVDEWVVRFGTVRRGLHGWAAAPETGSSSSSSYLPEGTETLTLTWWCGRTSRKRHQSRIHGASSAPPDPSLCVNGQVPGARGRSGCHSARLLQRSLVFLPTCHGVCSPCGWSLPYRSDHLSDTLAYIGYAFRSASSLK